MSMMARISKGGSKESMLLTAMLSRIKAICQIYGFKKARTRRTSCQCTSVFCSSVRS